jgi:RTX calcium-binding nonapeptide repeat (4 copies)
MKSRLRSILSYCSLAVALTILPMSKLSAQTLDPQTVKKPVVHKDWLDEAVTQQYCPLRPVNVPPHAWKSPDTLRSRITISNENLNINGTDDPDHIVVSAGRKPRLADVTWNGVDLGEYGPISGITLDGNAGDDALIVKSGVSIPAIVDGGTGDDCIQGGSGGDQLFGDEGDDVVIAGTGRPAIKGGVGSNRLVLPQSMGTLRYGPGVDDAIIAPLKQYYDLKPLGAQTANSKAKPSPIILGVSDLSMADFALVQQAYAAGQAVLVTNGMKADAEHLRIILGHPNSVTKPTGNQSDDTQIAISYFRQVLRPGTSAHQYHTGSVPTLDSTLNDTMIERLSQIFSANDIISQAPTTSQLQTAAAQSKISPTAVGDGTPNNLQSIADSYLADTSYTEPTYGVSTQINNSAWAVRSFANQTDFYYVLQEVDYYEPGGNTNNLFAFFNEEAVNIPQSSLQTGEIAATQTSPASTQCSSSTTSGVDWSVGGSAGWNQQQGFNASVNGGVSVVNTKTVSCPGTSITNITQITSAQTGWTILKLRQYNSPLTSTYYNQWIWEIPTDKYTSGQTDYSYTTESRFAYTGVPIQTGDFYEVTPVDLTQWIPMPFGTTFSLQQPAISSVSPTSVGPGQSVTITGSGLYPSTVTGLVIGGTTVPTTQYTPVSDTEMQVFAPNQPGCNQAVGVQTTQGLSNTTVALNISGGGC